MRSLEADVASIALPGPDGQLIWRAMVGYHTQMLGTPLVGAGLVYRVIASGQAETISAAAYADDALRADFPLMVAEGVETGLGVPLAFADGGGRAPGRLAPHTVTPIEQRLVQVLAEQVISTITLARLYEETGRQHSFLESIIQHVPAGIVAFDLPDFRVREVNRFYLQFLDKPFRSETVDLHGRRLEEFIPGAAESGVLGDLPARGRQWRVVHHQRVRVHGLSARRDLLGLEPGAVAHGPRRAAEWRAAAHY